MKPSTVKEMTGQRFGRVVVVHFDRIDKYRQARWLCRCDCGTEFATKGASLRQGDTQSCGCLRRDIVASQIKSRSTTHAMSRTKEYRCWCHMIGRCCNAKDKAFSGYGGRGITVCNEWRNSFDAFFADMGLAPSPRHSIERDDVNGDYCKANCRWATQLEQARNTRLNVVLTHNGLSKPISEWVGLVGIKAGTIYSRIERGWSHSRALTEAPVVGRRRIRPIAP